MILLNRLLIVVYITLSISCFNLNQYSDDDLKVILNVKKIDSEYVFSMSYQNLRDQPIKLLSPILPIHIKSMFCDFKKYDIRYRIDRKPLKFHVLKKGVGGALSEDHTLDSHSVEKCDFFDIYVYLDVLEKGEVIQKQVSFTVDVSLLRNSKYTATKGINIQDVKTDSDWQSTDKKLMPKN